MSAETEQMTPLSAEVRMVAPEIVRQIEALASLGWRAKPSVIWMIHENLTNH